MVGLNIQTLSTSNLKLADQQPASPDKSFGRNGQHVARSEIASFYRGRSILITGATGFIGKVLLEKILRSCPEVGTVYILMREKSGKNSGERVGKLLESKAFDILRKHNPCALNKVIAVSGELSKPLLGLSPSDETLVTSEVSVVFHVAATVRFNECFKTCVELNVSGTNSVLSLCKKMANLVAMVHVTTAYANCELKVIEEKVYPSLHHPEKIMQAASWLNEKTMEEIFKWLKGGKYNAYTCTKALGEILVEKASHDIPVAIVRPSIVTPSLEEPYPGWNDSPNGVGAMLAAQGNGVFRCSYTKRDMIADFVPVDMVANLLVSVAWKLGSEKLSSDVCEQNFRVYNCSSGSVNPVTWGRAIEICNEHQQKACCYSTAVWYPNHVQMEDSYVGWRIRITLTELVPAILADVCLRILGKKPVARKLHNKIQSSFEDLLPFVRNEWEFLSENMPSLWSSMSEDDKKNFNFDMKSINWVKYVEDGCMGARTFFLKQDPTTLPQSRAHVKRLYWLNLAARTMFTYLLIRFTLRMIGVRPKLNPIAKFKDFFGGLLQKMVL